MIVDDDEFGIGKNLGMIETERLDGEKDPVVVVIRGHADGELHGGRFGGVAAGIGNRFGPGGLAA